MLGVPLTASEHEMDMAAYLVRIPAKPNSIPG
jgi:hypothetical protein